MINFEDDGGNVYARLAVLILVVLSLPVGTIYVYCWDNIKAWFKRVKERIWIKYSNKKENEDD